MNLELSSFSGKIKGFGRQLDVQYEEADQHDDIPASLRLDGLSVREAQMVLLMVEKVGEQWSSQKDVPAVLPDVSAPTVRAEPMAAPAVVPAVTATAASAPAEPEKRRPGRPSKAETEARKAAEAAKAVEAAPTPVVASPVNAPAIDAEIDEEVPFDTENDPPKNGHSFSKPEDLPAELRAADKLSKIVSWCMRNGAADADAAVEMVKKIRPHHELLAKHEEAKITEKIPRLVAEFQAGG